MVTTSGSKKGQEGIDEVYLHMNSLSPREFSVCEGSPKREKNEKYFGERAKGRKAGKKGAREAILWFHSV